MAINQEYNNEKYKFERHVGRLETEDNIYVYFNNADVRNRWFVE